MIEVHSDDDIIGAGIERWRNDVPITDGQARVIASRWHEGQGSSLYSFTSTGSTRNEDPAFFSDLLEEIDAEMGELRPHQEFARDALSALWCYVKAVGARGPVEGWSTVWGGDLHPWMCLTCGAEPLHHTDTAHQPNWVKE